MRKALALMAAAVVATVAMADTAEARGCRPARFGFFRSRPSARAANCGGSSAGQAALSGYALAAPATIGNCPHCPMRE